MKKLFYLFAFVAFTLTSCDKNEVLKQAIQEPTPPTFVSKLPNFNAEALYVVGREYETHKNGTSQKSSKFKVKGNVVNVNTMTLYEYIEMRLIELYPDVAYVGMAKDMEQEGTQAMQMYKDYLAKRKVWEESQGIFREEEIETPEFTSIEDEIQLLSMTPEEEANFRNLNALATGSEFAATSDFENLSKIKSFTSVKKTSQATANNDGIIDGIEFTLLLAAYLVVTPYACARAIICKERAENMQQRDDFYKNKTGMLPDAFKHIYVSMMLRRYLSENWAYLIMDVAWENIVSPNNLPLDKYMDYHNNNVGRNTQYDQFRGKWLADMHAWERWGTRIRDFVDNTNNGTKMNWLPTTDKENVKNDRNNADKNKYIWYEKL